MEPSRGEGGGPSDHSGQSPALFLSRHSFLAYRQAILRGMSEVLRQERGMLKISFNQIKPNKTNQPVRGVKAPDP